MRVATPCLRRAATYFFSQQKKGAPAGSLHSASGVQLAVSQASSIVFVVIRHAVACIGGMP